MIFQKLKLDRLRLPSIMLAAWEVLEWWKWGWSNGWIYFKNYFLTRKYSKMYRTLALEQISILLISYFCFLWKENDICNFLIFYFFSFWPTELRILLSYTGSMLYNVYNIWVIIYTSYRACGYSLVYHPRWITNTRRVSLFIF